MRPQDSYKQKYPFKKDPGVLNDIGKEAKACQVSQECQQIKNSTHSQYVKQFREILSVWSLRYFIKGKNLDYYQLHSVLSSTIPLRTDPQT